LQEKYLLAAIFFISVADVDKFILHLSQACHGHALQKKFFFNERSTKAKKF